jgi:hypothetical protein
VQRLGELTIVVASRNSTGNKCTQSPCIACKAERIRARAAPRWMRSGRSLKYDTLTKVERCNPGQKPRARPKCMLMKSINIHPSKLSAGRTSGTGGTRRLLQLRGITIEKHGHTK